MFGRRARFGVDADRGHVALTFDDGPDPRFTPEVLAILDRLGARATFFLLGAHAEAHPDLVRAVLDAGHVVGCHSWSHPNPWETGLPALARDYRRGKRAVEAATGGRVHLFRPPTGYHDRRTATVTRALDLHPWVWSCNPQDYEAGAETPAIVDAVVSAGPGTVVLLHDGMPLMPGMDERCLDRSATVAAVEPIVSGWRANGWELVTLD